jgi:DNA gyrase/topoisomerase IV subunit B
MEKEYNEDDIQSVSFSEAIRLRPQLYLKKCFDENSLNLLPFEVLCPAFDAYFDGKCFAANIEVWENEFIVTFDTGLSLEAKHSELSSAELIMTALFACRNEKKHLSVGDEFCELGMFVINCVSEHCTLTTVSSGKKGLFTFSKGETISREITSSENEQELTIVQMKIDQQLFGNLKFTAKGLLEKANVINERFPDFKLSVIDRL